MRGIGGIGALGALVVVLAGGLVASSRTAGAQEPAPAGARAVWVGGLYAFMKVDASTGAILVDLTEETPYSLAVDNRRSRVWVRQNNLVTAFDFTGNPVRTLAVAGFEPLDVDPSDGSLWIGGARQGYQPRLEHRDAEGQLLASAVLPEEGSISVVNVDPPRGRVWVLVREYGGASAKLRAYDPAGQLVNVVNLSDPGTCDLAVESDSGRLWVAASAGVQRYSSTGTLELDVPFPPRSRDFSLGCAPSMAPDGQGGVWAAAHTAVFHFDADGTLLAQIDPWPRGPEPWPWSDDEWDPNIVQNLAVDPTDYSVWIVSQVLDRIVYEWVGPGDLTHLSPTGQILQQVRLRNSWWYGAVNFDDVAVSVEILPPALIFTAPAEGATIGANQPALEVTYTSVGAGIDPATLAFTKNGQPLAVTCTHSATGASCTPNAPLADGAHTISATVADVDGRVSAPAEVTFTVDTVPPTVTLTAPSDGLVTNQTQQVVEGEVSEGATLVVKRNAEAVESFSVPSAAAFATSPVPLAEGANQLEVRALDLAGNPGQAGRSVTLDTVPPAAVPAAQIAVSPVVDGQATVRGSPGSAEAGAIVTVTNTRTLVSVSVVVQADGSFVLSVAASAGDSLVIVVKDAAGNTSPTTSAGVPPAVELAITEPAADSTVAAGQLVVRGTISGSPAEVAGIAVNGFAATVEGTAFLAVVPVDETVTSLTVTATTMEGAPVATASTRISVLPPTGVPDAAVQLLVSSGGGIAPVSVRFRLLARVGVQSIFLDADGDGVVDFSGQALPESPFTFTSPGIVTPRVTVTDPAGGVYTAHTIVQVFGAAALDQRLQLVWRGFKDALRVGNVTAALSFLHEEARDAYGPTLLSVSPTALADIDRYMTDIQQIEVGPGGAEYEMVRTRNGEPISFAVWFEIDRDGVWRLKRF